MAYPSKLNPEQILDAAQIILEMQGAEALTMRTLAQALSVRPSSLYRHFDSQAALLRALGDRAALNLRDQLALASQGLEARPALLSAAQAYLEYARQHPHIYALLLTGGDELPPEQLAASAGKALWNTLLELVGALSGNPDDTDHAVAFWTFLHGFAALESSGTFGKSGPKGGLDVGLEAILGHMEQSSD